MRNIKQNVNNYENIIGRKIDNCGDCKYGIQNENWLNIVDCKLYKTFYNIHDKKCPRFRISDKIKAVIMIIMNDCDTIGIDIHPRYLIGKITPIQSLDWFINKDGSKNLHNYITRTTVKLELRL